MAKQKTTEVCMHHHGFPVFSVVVFVLAVLWLLSDLKVITADIPWLPIVVVIASLGMIIKHYMWCSH